MGICLEQYRFAIGSNNCLKHVRLCVCHQQPTFIFLLSVFGFFIYSIVITALIFSMVILLSESNPSEKIILYKCSSSFLFPDFIFLPIFALNQKFLKIILDSVVSVSPIFYKRKMSIKYILKCFLKRRFTHGICYLYSLCYIALNLILIVIANTSLLNPGPSSPNLSVFFQNVQGLVTLNTLNNTHPTLNITKVSELQTYLEINQFDIIVLNETWLKPSIRNNEIIPFHNYIVFRRDRSVFTHPPDKKNPKKFRRNGGGVLIAVKSDLGLNPIMVKSPCNAEFLSIKLSLPNNKKLCISTCYRVGTLGDENFLQISKRLHNIVKSKQIKGHLVIGDFNLDSIDWALSSATAGLHKRFLDLFADVGLSQLVNYSTHYLGNILDLCLTSLPHIVTNLRVLDLNEAVKSDHSGITLELKYKCRKLRTPSYTIFNFSKANWDALNYDLCRVPWDSLLKLCDIHTAWPKFKCVLNKLCEKHIPKIKVDGKTSPPWFDSDIHKLCRKKDRYRKRFKDTGDETYNTKFKNCRKEIKKAIKTKMRSNFDDDSNPSFVTKKFWSFVKSSSNSTRIPDTVNLDGIFRSEPADKADIFNDYFCQQFSAPSNYNIDIDYSNDPLFDFYIDFRYVRKILSSLNPNKSQGPDGISGKVLKNCAASIAYPITLLFNMSFSQGQIPPDWKLANVVPVHKKGDKSSVENYRPISLTSLIMKIFENVSAMSSLDYVTTVFILLNMVSYLINRVRLS